MRLLTKSWFPSFTSVLLCPARQPACCTQVDLLCSLFLPPVFSPMPYAFNQTVRFPTAPVSQYTTQQPLSTACLGTLPRGLTFTSEVLIHQYHHFDCHCSRKPKHPAGKCRYEGKPFTCALCCTHIARLCLRQFICHFNVSSEWVIGLFQRANCLTVRGHLDFYVTCLSPWRARLQFKCKYLQDSFQHHQWVKAINKRTKYY